MPNYSNPATMFGNNAQMIPGQPLAGFLAGEQGAYATRVADQNIRDADLGFLAEMHKYEQAKLDDPLKAAERESGISTAGVADQWNKSGGALASKEANMGQVVAQTKSMEESTKEKKHAAALEFVNEAADAAKNFKGTDQASVDAWKELKARGEKEHNIKLPYAPTAEFSQVIAQKAMIAQNNLAEKRRIAEQDKRNEAVIEAAKIGAQKATDVQGMKDETAKLLKTAQITSNEKLARIKAEMADPKTLEALAVKHINEKNFDELETDLDALYLQATKAEPFLKLNTPEKVQEWKDNKRKRLEAQAGRTTATTPKSVQTYSSQQEAAIDATMKKTGNSREAVIEAAKAAGKL